MAFNDNSSLQQTVVDHADKFHHCRFFRNISIFPEAIRRPLQNAESARVSNTYHPTSKTYQSIQTAKSNHTNQPINTYQPIHQPTNLPTYQLTNLQPTPGKLQPTNLPTYQLTNLASLASFKNQSFLLGQLSCFKRCGKE